ncbi:bifunctional diaminohydroxyphosphoribosylaminopyrimidine deaminase/5-amino-6-(5-phosphoribosylamino)uracil reductase RibD [Nitrincola schmidtii]|uniref:bifunctional diaminohydroxyphosphoribosylaminopyrimidine deaminase/5-amino-6-(5-phosphoribosylamino)uracil reductase RibD n=1 Tax=Nitrincola schmidtii TaxID=1730894 RepID=UPI00124EA876|nr:bifunctional diaminohydroxyphosphoribosylaminopyrimidine deaminase/5-amino-6-(5-phosphoribosylamino)uracil reductase RibD [Nitrincola schmidtii]
MSQVIGSSEPFTTEDRIYMSRALQLAARGLYTTDPNPRVGCVIVKADQIIGEAWHQRAGEPHAEPLALQQAGERARGATAYVTLEPCSHFGRTPPCADALVKAGLARVVVAMQDPNPLVAGRGLQKLQEAGITVACGLFADQAQALNPGFIKRMRHQRPFVRLKSAMSLDGRTAMHSGESQWITGPEARADVQRLRARSSAIMTGIGSVLLDNPQLTVRDPSLVSEGIDHQPLRVVMDSHLRLPLDANILENPAQVLVVTTDQADASKRRALLDLGTSVLSLTEVNKQLPITQVLDYLAQERQCNELLVETGAMLAGSFIEQALVDEWVVYMAPTLLGSDARPLVKLPLTNMVEQRRLTLTDLRQLGADVRMTYTPLTEH